MMTKSVWGNCLRLLLLISIATVALGTRKVRAGDMDLDFPVVHILATDACASENPGDTATFTVFRSGPTKDALTVHYRLAGTAVNGIDYVELSGSVDIPALASSASITLTPIDDTVVEGNESVAVFLEQPAVWPPPYLVSWPSFALAHIEDNDLPPTNQPPQVRIVNPPDGSVFIGPVDLKLIAQAADRDGRVRTVEFFDGTNSLGVVSNRTLLIRPALLAEDALDAAAEIDPLAYPDLDPVQNVDPAVIPATVFVLPWKDVPAGPHRLVAVATDNQGASTTSDTVRIHVTEPPPQSIVNVRASDPIAAEPDPAGDRLKTATFTIHRSGSTDIPMTVYYRLGGTADNGVDYRELPHNLTIPIGARTADVVIEPIDDTLVEGPESVVLHLVPPVCIDIFPPPPDCYRVGPFDTARAVIQDNDPATTNHPPEVEIVRPLDGSIFLAPADIALVAAARDPDGRVVRVEFFAGTNSLGVVSNNPSALNSDTPAFALKWADVPRGDYILTAEATDNDGAVSQSKPVEIKVVDRILPPIVSIEATDPEGAETLPGVVPNPAVFTVKRTGPTDRPLVVFYSVGGSASNGVDYALLPGRLNIPIGAESAPITIEPIDDRLVEGIETVGITIEPPICIAFAPDASLPTANCYLVGTNNHARAIIRDNDPAPTNTPPAVAIVQPADGDIFVAPADIRICARAHDAEGPVRSVEFFAGEKSLGIVSNSLSVIGLDPAAEAARIDPVFCLAWSNAPAGGYELTAKATDGRGLSSISEPVRIKVIEASRLPVVTIEATDPIAAEGSLLVKAAAADSAGASPDPNSIDPVEPPIIVLPDFAVFTVSRDRATNQSLTVYYRLGGTASNGVDYRTLDGTVVIPAGARNARIVIAPFDDKLVEGTETVIVQLIPVACPAVLPPTGGCYLVGEPDRATAYILDDDTVDQAPRVAITTPAQGSTFTAPAAIKIVATVKDPDGYVTQVEFFAGSNSIGKDSRVFIVAPPPGQVQEFSITWSNVPPGRYDLTAVATDDQGTRGKSEPVTIKVGDSENIPPRVAIVHPDVGERFRKGAEIPIVVQALDPDGWVAEMEFFDGTNRIGSEQISFLVAPPPGLLQRFSMVWSNASAGRHVLTARAIDDQGAANASSPVAIEVVDVPPLPTVSIFAIDPLAREGDPANHAVFRVRRTGETNLPLTVSYAIGGTASNGLDYARIPDSVTIPTGRRTARVVIAPLDDKLREGIETVILRLQPTSLYDLGRWSRAAAVILDNDVPRPETLCLPDHNFQLRMDGTNGMCYRIELSGDLIRWETTDATAALEDWIHFVDPEASDLPGRFYRLRIASPVELLGDE